MPGVKSTAGPLAAYMALPAQKTSGGNQGIELAENAANTAAPCDG
jgi:hypothetical protein